MHLSKIKMPKPWWKKHRHKTMRKVLNTLLLIALTGYEVQSQDLEPRRYAAIPTKANGIIVLYGLMKGNIVSDPALPISDFSITAHNAVAGYLRTFGVAGKLSRIAISIPYTYMIGDLKINGRDTGASRGGFNDAQVRFGINLIGSPALERKNFREYTQKAIIGFSFVVNVPTGTYHKEKLVNTGTNRWAFKPEVGISKRFKRFYTEAYTGVWFFTKNTEYLGSKTLEQKPIFSIQAHICYYLKNQMWFSINGTRFNGGETLVDDASAGDLFDNWRVGATWSVPFKKGHSVKLQFNVGAFARRGYDYNMISVGYQYVFF